MKKEENIRGGKDIKKEPELDYDKAESLGNLWAAYNVARVQGYDEKAAEILKEINGLKKEILEE